MSRMSDAVRSDTILVADDDPVIRGNLRVFLQSEGYHVTEAPDGLEASRKLDDRSIALALLDLRMPGCTGMDVLRDHQDQPEEYLSSSSRPWAVAATPSKP